MKPVGRENSPFSLDVQNSPNASEYNPSLHSSSLFIFLTFLRFKIKHGIFRTHSQLTIRAIYNDPEKHFQCSY